jgi:Zn finger protein HypA/HybF involved in hydrogenase expression
MSYIKNEDIRGVQTEEGQVKCTDCMGYAAKYQQEDLILERTVEDSDGVYYCDACGKSL